MDFLEDLEMYDQAMFNAYNFITGRETLDHLIIKLEVDHIDQYPLPFDPLMENGRTPAVIDMVISYFIELEEYEKCAELTRIKKKCLDSKIPTE